MQWTYFILHLCETAVVRGKHFGNNLMTSLVLASDVLATIFFIC